MRDDTVNVRYMVSDVEESIEFYTRHLRFTVLSNMAPAFADVRRGNLRLLLSGPTSSAGRPMPMDEHPDPAAGTATASSTTSRPKSRDSATQGRDSATTSSSDREAHRSSSRTLRRVVELFRSAGN